MKQLFKHSWKIAVLITIVSILGMGIGVIPLLGDAAAEHEIDFELTPDGFKFRNRIKKGQTE